MRYLAGLFFTLLFTHNVVAGNLCDATCEFTITFPEGGSIEAVEALTFTFGDGGFVNDGVVTTGYSAGETMSLAITEVLMFQAGGSIDLGIGGNLDYSSVAVTTSGIMVTRVEEPDKVQIYNIEFNGGSFELFGYTELSGTLSGSGGTISMSGSVNFISGSINHDLVLNDSGTLIWDDPNGCSISPATGTVTISNTAVSSGVTPVTNTSCTMTLTAGVFTIGDSGLGVTEVNGVAIDSNVSNITFTGGIFELTPVSVASVGPLQVTSLTQEFLATLPDGISLPTDDGNTCTVTAGECFTDAGAKYVVVDGKLVEPALDGSGLINLAGLFAIFVLLSTFRFAGFNRRN